MSRPERRGRTLAAGAVALTAAWVAALPNGTTYAAWSDFAVIPVSVGAGVWLAEGDPALPDQCLGMVFDRIIVGTNNHDILNGTDGNDLIFGLQGKDVLNGFGGQDCLVGGNGKDELNGEDGDDVLVGGNGKDELTGDDDDDVLVGGNGKDKLTGGSGTDDVCDGGRGKNTLIQCESPDTSTTSPFELSAPTAATNESVLVVETSEAKPTSEPMTATAPETGSGASVEDPPEAPLVEPAIVEPAGAVDTVVKQPEDVDATGAPTDDAAVEVQP